jgi:hypothetical protein
MNKW